MPMKVHRIVVLVVDSDDLGAKHVINVLENTRYPNHCIDPKVVTVETREIEWSDDHPLNQGATWRAALKNLFET